MFTLGINMKFKPPRCSRQLAVPSNPVSSLLPSLVAGHGRRLCCSRQQSRINMEFRVLSSMLRVSACVYSTMPWWHSANIVYRRNRANPPFRDHCYRAQTTSTERAHLPRSDPGSLRHSRPCRFHHFLPHDKHPRHGHAIDWWFCSHDLPHWGSHCGGLFPTSHRCGAVYSLRRYQSYLHNGLHAHCGYLGGHFPLCVFSICN